METWEKAFVSESTSTSGSGSSGGGSGSGSSSSSKSNNANAAEATGTPATVQAVANAAPVANNVARTVANTVPAAGNGVQTEENDVAEAEIADVAEEMEEELELTEIEEEKTPLANIGLGEDMTDAEGFRLNWIILVMAAAVIAIVTAGVFYARRRVETEE